MSDITQALNSLKRPGLLVRAARAGLADYVRERDLLRLLGTSQAPSPRMAVQRLMEKETELEATRRDGAASYSFATHIDVLVALIAESQFFRTS